MPVSNNVNISEADRLTANDVFHASALLEGLTTSVLAFAEMWAITKPYENIVLTCGEAETLSDLLAWAGYHEAAEDVIECHSAHDTDPEDDHYVGDPE
jgi:hypothetical protein